ncbi:hypothetical protein SAMN02745157_2997 [Kaistia soli DSM 19436]|uniref:Uncharacterized protein n=1 Tax=Kaistia soli DSM 19436 TaxID=1122133 RepID=A0A1M5EHD6_9HYPH|nr:hypothetical protein [Kaistia soli]SHF78472.1 hypothetical protein SAMN02745157_2997 [Kaistia soli DSM 19436]
MTDGATEMLLCTSIPPRFGGEDEARQLSRAGLTIADAIASFEAASFRVVSVNRQGEAAGIRGFPTVEIREVPPGGLFPNKYGPNFGQIFEQFSDDPGAIVNADIYMVKSDIASVLATRPGTVLIARRLDVATAATGVVGTYNRGIDGIFFSGGALAELAADPDVGAFQMGAPYWDILLPTVASLHHSVEFVAAPFLLHEVHPARWNSADYKMLRERAVNVMVAHARRYQATRPRAAAFLAGLEAFLGGPFEPLTERKIKDSAVFMNLWLAKIEQSPSRLVAVDYNDPTINRFISQLFSHTAEALSIANWLDAREDDGQQSLFGKVHRFVKLILRTRRAQKKVERVRKVFPS